MSLNVNLIQQSFGKASLAKEDLADIFYSTLFERYPAVKPLFASTDFDSQKKKLMASLTFVVRNLKASDTLVNTLKDLGANHVNYGAQEAHFDAVGECMLYALEQTVGDQWNEETKAAWVDAYTVVADTMKSAMSDQSERPLAAV